ncbi:protein PEAK3 [Talpa occidentalis]|uniref:protein PEAK3 n=1 Tax=Talpa occidentalis TaxID=50954 RepID=UPI00188E74BB|nr:protein PEAK3 [Talpa occidentalis]
MSSPELPTEAPGPDVPRWAAQPTYSNLGEIRAHLLPAKACRSRASGSLSTDQESSPPPLPKKTLARTRSLPPRVAGTPSPNPGQPRRRFLGSLSVNESWAGAHKAGLACSPANLPFEWPDAHLDLSLRDLSRLEAVDAALEARQLKGLHTMHARLKARLLGGHPGPCHPGHSFRLLDRSPCVESGDTLYYRMVRVDEEAWHVLAAKVPKPGTKEPHPWGLELQASLPPHFNLQGLCGLVPEGALPDTPWRGPVMLTAEVPERTVAQWLAEVHAQRPSELAWAIALMLLQLSAALEHLEDRGAVLTELRPENLLLAVPRGCPTHGPPRLLLADSGHARPQPPGLPGTHALQLGRLLHELLGPSMPVATPLALGLRHLAAQLLHLRPSAAQTRCALQTLLWGPGPELNSHTAPLGSWLRVRRTLLVLHLAERAAGGEAPGLEDWLCCEYLTEATEASLGHALALLWH